MKWLWVLALVACDAREVQHGEAPPVAMHWTYAPPHAAWAIGEPNGRIGRSQQPEGGGELGIAGDAEGELRAPTVWQVPGAARALVYGTADGKTAVDAIDIDGGRVLWRDTAACAGPIVGVTAQAFACADASGTRVIGLDGRARWNSSSAFLAMTGSRVIVTSAAGVTIHDDATASDVELALPAGVPASGVLAACGDPARELYAIDQDGKLVRIADDAKMVPAVTWRVAVGNVVAIDACSATVLVTAASDAGTSLVAIGAGKIIGRVDGMRGFWPARDGSEQIEIATATGVASWPRDLAGPPVIDTKLPPLAELLAKRGERRLVRATPHAAALIDRTGVRAYVPLAELGAALGDRAIVAASWLGPSGATLHRYALPPPWRRVLRVPPLAAGVSVPAELRDLPLPKPLDETRAIAALASGDVAAIAIDPATPETIYAAAGTSLARASLSARAWSWTRSDGCEAQAIGLAITDDIVVCASSRDVRATTKAGAPAWQWHTPTLDSIAAAGDLVLVFDADRLVILDAQDGHVRGEFASDDGDAMRAAALDVAGTTLLVTYEHGQLVARLPAADFLAAWSLAVDGVVAHVEPAGDGVLVMLEDGDAYRVDARTGAATPLPGIGLHWRASADTITGETAGEPTPPAVMPIAPPVIPKPRPLHDSPENPPNIATPWTVPPPGPPAWQLTLFERSGGVRARNDYALPPPIAPAPRGAAGAPLVVTYGHGEALVLDERGDPLRRVQLSGEHAFATVVDGKPVAGVVLANPLRVVLF